MEINSCKVKQRGRPRKKTRGRPPTKSRKTFRLQIIKDDSFEYSDYDDNSNTNTEKEIEDAKKKKRYSKSSMSNSLTPSVSEGHTPSSKLRKKRLLDDDSYCECDLLTQIRIKQKDKKLKKDSLKNVQTFYLGQMNFKCPKCGALHFHSEVPRKRYGKNMFNDCCNGNLEETFERSSYPDFLFQLFQHTHAESSNFFKNIRQINCAFACGSFSPSSLFENGFDYVIRGKIKRNIAPMIPLEDRNPRFGQVYVYESSKAVQIIKNEKQNEDISIEVLNQLSSWFHQFNPFATSYKMMKEVYESELINAMKNGDNPKKVFLAFDVDGFKLGSDHAAVKSNKVAAVFANKEGKLPTQNLSIQAKDDHLYSISMDNPLCDPLLYPLFFPNGEIHKRKRDQTNRIILFPKEENEVNGKEIELPSEDSDLETNEKEITYHQNPLRQNIPFRSDVRAHALNMIAFRETWSPMHLAGKLFQQYIVDSFCRIEEIRLFYFRSHQQELFGYRCNRTFDALNDNDFDSNNSSSSSTLFPTESSSICCPSCYSPRIILPSSFVGSQRWLQQCYMDAMSIVSRFGKPDIFLTFTCNPMWKEIQENLHYSHLRASDRPDLISRVFKQKLDELMKDLKRGVPFGELEAYVYKVEFQKKGLPHCHMLLTLKDRFKPRSAEVVDQLVCAEIPSICKGEDDDGIRSLVMLHMVHGPCGTSHPSAHCMVDGNCSKGYPKQFCDRTFKGKDGKFVYKRTDLTSCEIHKKPINNKWIVPYNPYLLKKFNAHINVEICSSVRAVNYLFKYIYKKPEYLKEKITKLDKCQNLSEKSQTSISCPNIFNSHKGSEASTALISSDNAEKSSECILCEKSVDFDTRTNISTLNEAITRQINSEQPSNKRSICDYQVKDEIREYINLRFVGSSEAYWRLVEYPLHKMSHTVVRLAVHLPEKVRLLSETNTLHNTSCSSKDCETTLTAFFKLNKKSLEMFGSTVVENNQDSRNFTYPEIGLHFRFDLRSHSWIFRSRNVNVITRLYTVSQRDEERYFLRILLLNVKGPTSFEDLLYFNKEKYKSFKEVALARGLFTDCFNWDQCLEEISKNANGKQLRIVFSHILLFNNVSDPVHLWNKYKLNIAEDYLSDDIEEEAAVNKAYYEIADIFENENKQLKKYLPPPSERIFDVEACKMTNDEHYLIAEQNMKLLNDKQKEIFEDIVEHICQRPPFMGRNCRFLDGPGGSGKTFLYVTLYHYLCSKNIICQCVAWTGIAATLLPKGKTVHSFFHLPVPIDEHNEISLMDIHSEEAQSLRKVKCIIWDEASMAPKCALTAINNLLKILNENSLPFGGVMMILGGDFRQLPPVIKGGSKNEMITQCIKCSELWPSFVTHSLAVNMRARDNVEFAEYLKKIGEGSFPETDHNSKVNIHKWRVDKDDLIHLVFGEDNLNSSNHDNLLERCILCTKNEDTFKINDEILNLIHSKSKTYTSIDSAEFNNPIHDRVSFTTEFINHLTPSGLPPHELKLKEGAIVILMRNLDMSNGLCNGIRLIVEMLGENYIELSLMSSDYTKRRKIILSPILMISRDNTLPFSLKRIQFPVRVSFAMTINKAQGQSFHHVGLYLPNPVFTHGQLYVAMSRCRCSNNLFIAVPNKKEYQHDRVLNVVYPELLF